MINFTLFDSFPEIWTPNQQQSYILKELGDALEQKFKFIIINAPTGVGKSPLAKTLANYSKACTNGFKQACDDFLIYGDDSKMLSDHDLAPFGTSVLTVTKALQDQYYNLFKDGDILKGKDNYSCYINENFDCSMGPCKFLKKQLKYCINNELCPYYNARNKAVTNKCSFLNYAMFDCLPPIVKNKQFIVCDEASELEFELVTRYTYRLDLKDLVSVCNGFPPPTPEINHNKDIIFADSKYYDWIIDLSKDVEYNYNKYIKDTMISMSENNSDENEHVKGKRSAKNKKTIIPKKLTKEQHKQIKLLSRYKEILSNLISYWNHTKFILERDRDNITFKPLHVDKLANEVFKYGETIVLMSATIVDHKKFAEKLGIKDYKYIEAESAFDSEKAPIRCATKFSLNYSNKNEVVPQMATLIQKLCDLHKNEKGIIHTHSMDILNILKRNIKDTKKRFLFREDGVYNKDIVDRHIDSKNNTILVSPSLTHGIDLKGDLGRFQILIKAPFLPINDSRIKLLYESDKDWYINVMLSTLVQTCGRCNRSEDDYSVTYILDKNILDNVMRYKDRLPKYFVNRFI